MTITARAFRLFTHNHPDADPDALFAAWGDPDLRAFWEQQVCVVLGVQPFQLTPAEAAWVDHAETCTGDHT